MTQPHGAAVGVLGVALLLGLSTRALALSVDLGPLASGDAQRDVQERLAATLRDLGVEEFESLVFNLRCSPSAPRACVVHVSYAEYPAYSRDFSPADEADRDALLESLVEVLTDSAVTLLERPRKRSTSARVALPHVARRASRKVRLELAVGPAASATPSLGSVYWGGSLSARWLSHGRFHVSCDVTSARGELTSADTHLGLTHLTVGPRIGWRFGQQRWHVDADLGAELDVLHARARTSLSVKDHHTFLAGVGILGVRLGVSIGERVGMEGDVAAGARFSQQTVRVNGTDVWALPAVRLSAAIRVSYRFP